MCMEEEEAVSLGLCIRVIEREREKESAAACLPERIR